MVLLALPRRLRNVAIMRGVILVRRVLIRLCLRLIIMMSCRGDSVLVVRTVRSSTDWFVIRRRSPDACDPTWAFVLVVRMTIFVIGLRFRLFTAVFCYSASSCVVL